MAVIAGRAGAVPTGSWKANRACPRLSEAANLPLRPGGGRLRGDLDGDGLLDRVTIRYAPRAKASCGFLLAVRTSSRIASTRVPQWYKPPEDMLVRDWPFPEPYLAAVVQLAPRRSEIVVARWHGAAVVEVSLYGLVDGRLALLRFHPRMSTTQETLSLFGTVGTGSTYARCARGGPLIVIGIGPTYRGGRWSASRSEYRLTGEVLRRTRMRTVTASRREIEDLAQRWGAAAAPFAGCTVARGRRL
jgi:hypothetical protein